MKHCLLFLACLTAASSSFAYDKQFDLGFRVFDLDEPGIDSNYDVDTKATFYFQDVNTGTAGPLNELAFLGKHSNLSAFYTYQYLDTKTFDGMSGETDGHDVGLGLEYFFSPYYVEAALSKSRYTVTLNDENTATRAKADDDMFNYRALVGYFPAQNLLLAAGIDGFNGDYEDDTRLAVKGKYVAPLANTRFLNIEADAAFGDQDHAFIATDYYLNRQVSIGLAYMSSDLYLEDEIVQIRSQYFFTPNFAISGVIGFGSDTHLLGLKANMRL